MASQMLSSSCSCYSKFSSAILPNFHHGNLKIALPNKLHSSRNGLICSAHHNERPDDAVIGSKGISISLVSALAAASIVFGGNALAAAPLIEDAASKAKLIQESIGRITSPSKSGSGLFAPGLDQSAFLANKSEREDEDAKKSREYVARSQLGERIEPELFAADKGKRRDQNIYGTSAPSLGSSAGNLVGQISPGEPGSESLKPGIEKSEEIGSDEFPSQGGERFQNIFEPFQESAKENVGRFLNEGISKLQPSGGTDTQAKSGAPGIQPSQAKGILDSARTKAQIEGAEDLGGRPSDLTGEGRSDFDEGGKIFSTIQDALEGGRYKDMS